jgi:hypothetical protein
MRKKIVDYLNEWLDFLRLILGPWSIVLLVLTILLIGAQLAQTDQSAAATLATMVAVVAGVLGGVVGKKWDERSETGIAVARGKGAIRSLKLLLGAVASLEDRVGSCLQACFQSQAKHPAVLDTTIVYLEETIGRCRLLEEGILASIESWTDIIPEANVNTQIGRITELGTRVQNLTQERDSLTSQIQEAQASQEETANLKQERDRKNQELMGLNQQLNAKLRDIGLSPASGPSPFGSATSTDSRGLHYANMDPFFWQREMFCKDCGRVYTTGITTIGGGECPACKSHNTIQLLRRSSAPSTESSAPTQPKP